MTDTMTGVTPPAAKPQRTVRVADPLWEAYKAVCEADGMTASEDLVDHMKRRVAERKAEREKDRHE